MGPLFLVYLSNRCTCESPRVRWISGRSFRPGINQFYLFIFIFFALSLFGGAVAREWALLSTWSGVGEIRDKWCSLLTPSSGYLWLINWSEKETCCHSGEAAPDLCGCASEQPTGCSGEMKRQPSLSRCCFPSCLLWREMKTIRFAGMDECARWGVRWRCPQFQASSALAPRPPEVCVLPSSLPKLLKPLMVASIY